MFPRDLQLDQDVVYLDEVQSLAAPEPERVKDVVSELLVPGALVQLLAVDPVQQAPQLEIVTFHAVCQLPGSVKDLLYFQALDLFDHHRDIVFLRLGLGLALVFAA